MRVGVIRGDLPGPIFVSDLEPTSQTNFPTEPEGQTRYLSRPDPDTVAAALASAPAVLVAVGNITFPLTIDGTNDALKLRQSAAPTAYTTVTLTHAVGIANLTALLALVNADLATAGLTVVARQGASNVRMDLWGDVGPGAYLQNDTVVGGSTANTALGLPNGLAWLVPSAASAINSLLPVGGPLDVRAATLATVVSPKLTAGEILAIQDAIAPLFIETPEALESLAVGVLAGFASANFNPDPRLVPPPADGPAITVVQDTGFTVMPAGAVPHIAGAVHNVPSAGDITITGTVLGNSEINATKVKVWNPATYQTVHLTQEMIVLGGGSVSATSIVLKAISLARLGLAASNKVQVQYGSLASNAFTTT